MSSHKKPHDDLMYAKATNFWKAVTVFAVCLTPIPFILIITGEFWKCMAVLGISVGLIILAQVQINAADFARKTGNTPKFPFN